MSERISNLFFVILISVFIFSSSSFSQAYDAVVDFDSVYQDRNVLTFLVPVHFDNSFAATAIHMSFTSDPPSLVTPIDIVTTGGRIADWEWIYPNISANGDTLKVVAMDSINTSPLAPGTGLLFYVEFQFECGWETDTTVSIIIDSIAYCNIEGYMYYDIGINNGFVSIGQGTAPRADANCDGLVQGGDATYLVNYMRLVVNCPCTECAGDVNGDGAIQGGDVTYLINYFRGNVAPPGPCD